MSYVLCIMQTQNALTCNNHFPVAHSGFSKGEELQSEVWGEASGECLRFSHKKTHSSTFFYRKKVCSERNHNGQRKNILATLSKSRSLAKVSERRLQPVAYARGAPKRAPPLRPSSIHVTSLCCSDTARKIVPSCGKFSTRHKRMQGRGTVPCPPLAL